MRLAEILDVDFRFTWPSGRVDKDPSHAITAAEEFFSAEFMAAHHVDHAESKIGYALPAGPDDDLDSLRAQLAAAEHGLLASNHPLRRWIDPEAVPAITRGFATEFSSVGFHPRIDAAIAAARSIPLDNPTVGIHLRAGDNLFGRYRTWTRFWNKAVPVPVARALIERFRREGQDVLVFGQDTAIIAELCATTGAIDAATLRPSGRGRRAAGDEQQGLSAPEEAMFDLVLMSRCRRIISGWSGFAIQAASLADKSVESHFDLVRPQEAIDIIEQDIAQYGDRYDPAHRAFAWWFAYYAARDELSVDTSILLVEKALDADPTNPRYRLRVAALHYRNSDIDRGDDALLGALEADVGTGDKTLESVLLFSLLTVTGYDSEEIFDDIERGARDGPGPAHLYRAALRAQRGDADGSAEDLAAFRASIAGEPWWDDAADAAAAGTVEHRLRRAGRTG